MAINFKLLLLESDYDAMEYIRAHQYLYYVLASPVLSDYDYDRYVRWTCLDDGKGGSDNWNDYNVRERSLARLLQSGRKRPFPDYYEERA